MKHLRLIVLAVFAVAAFSAVVTSAASAAQIKYTGSGSFTITSGSGKLETATNHLQISCKADNGTGKLGVSPAKTAELTVTFTGCETLGKKCTSAGLTAGNVQTTKAVAAFGDINATEVGALLAPRTGTPFVVPVKCGEVAFEAKGSVIGALSPVGVLTKSLTATFKQTLGVQEIKKFEGGTENTLEAELGDGFEKAGLESKETLVLGGEGTLEH